MQCEGVGGWDVDVSYRWASFVCTDSGWAGAYGIVEGSGTVDSFGKVGVAWLWWCERVVEDDV